MSSHPKYYLKLKIIRYLPCPCFISSFICELLFEILDIWLIDCLVLFAAFMVWLEVLLVFVRNWLKSGTGSIRLQFRYSNVSFRLSSIICNITIKCNIWLCITFEVVLHFIIFLVRLELNQEYIKEKLIFKLKVT